MLHSTVNELFNLPTSPATRHDTTSAKVANRPTRSRGLTSLLFVPLLGFSTLLSINAGRATDGSQPGLIVLGVLGALWVAWRLWRRVHQHTRSQPLAPE